MSRRFTLFALLTAACLLFASCGGLFTSSSTEITFDKTKSDTKPVASTTTSIRIPLPSRTQRTVMDPSAPNTPLELCDSYKFTLKSTDDEYSAAADADDQFIEFPEVEYGTYTITATAYGKLGDGKTTAIANYSKSNIVVDKASVTITVKFTLTENAKIYLYGYTGTPVTNADGSTTQPTYAGKDGKTLLSEKTTSSDGRTETEISYAVDLETGENTTDAQGNPVVTKTVVKETQTSGDEKVTTTEFSLNETEEGCSKRITIEEGTKTTVKKYDDNSSDESQPTSMEVTEKLENSTTISTYDNGDWEHPSAVTVIENTQKTTTTYDESGKESATLDTIIIEITAGQNAGQKTIQKYDTAADGNPKTEETVISAVGTAVVSSNFTTVGETTSPQKETYYAAGYDYEHPDSTANALLKNKEIEYTVSGGARTGKTETTFNYTAGLTTAKDYDGTTGIVPVAKTVENVYSLSEGNATLTETITTENVFTSGVKSKTIVTETTAGQEANTKTTTTEYNLNQTNCDMRVTVAQGNTTTVSRYAENPANPATATLVEKDVTTVTGGVETTKYFTGEDMSKPSSKVETSSSTRTTTEYLSSNKDKTNKVTEVILTGENAGQTTEIEYNTSLTGLIRSTVTVTNPDTSSVVTTFNNSDKETKKIETDVNNVQTTSLYNYTTNASSQQVTTVTTYQAGFNPEAQNADPNTYHVARTVESTYNGNTIESTTTTDFEYKTGKAYNENNEEQIPLSKETIVTRNAVGEITLTTEKSYSYTSSGKPENFTTVKNGETVAYQIYTYQDDKPEHITIKEEGQDPSYYAFKPVNLIVYSSDYTATTTIEDTNIVFSSVGGDTFFKCPCNSEWKNVNTSGISQTDIANYLRDHYVLVGNSIGLEGEGTEDLDFLKLADKDKVKPGNEGFFKYIFKVDFDGKLVDGKTYIGKGCFKRAPNLVEDSEGNLYLKCYLHNQKSGCTNFWGSSNNFSTAKDRYILTDTNYGCAPADNKYPGNNQGI